MNANLNKYMRRRLLIVEVLVLFLLVAIQSDKVKGQSKGVGNVRGTIILTENQSDSNVKLVPNATIQLEKAGRISEIISDNLGDFSNELRVGKYCLKSVRDNRGNLLRISSNQHRCFNIQKKKTTRFDILLDSISMN